MLNSFGYINDSSMQKHKEEKEKNAAKKAKTLLYICATIWHENTNEMLQLLKSIMRLDIDHHQKKTSINGDSFEYEAHIFFDDAITNFPDGSSEPNEYVQNLIQVVSQAACFAHKRSIELEPAIKVVTPYGGRLKFKLPGGNYLVVHLKDKSKIRNKKRWSQVMYMYYLVGYKYFGSLEAMEAYYDVDFPTKSPSINEEFKGFGSLLNKIGAKLRTELENTFILTLDGDVEFRPAAVRLMLDKIRENKRIGSVCGRVHPIGSGPVVWYQIFEYAVGHWLQKVSEHMFVSFRFLHNRLFIVNTNCVLHSQNKILIGKCLMQPGLFLFD
jgi:chitin synthase